MKKRDSPEEWKCQPNKWLSSKEEIHEILVGWFSVTLGSALSAALATWVVNGGHTTLYYQVWDYVRQLKTKLFFISGDNMVSSGVFLRYLSYSWLLTTSHTGIIESTICLFFTR